MAQRVLILVGPESDEAEVGIGTHAGLYPGWRVATSYIAGEVDGVLQMFDPTPLSEVITNTRSDWHGQYLAKHSLGDAQQMTLVEAFDVFGGWVRVNADTNSSFKHGSELKQLCAVMRVRGLRFADAEPPERFYTNREWRQECGLSQATANALVGNQVAGPTMLAALDSTAISLLHACYNERGEEVRALHTRLRSKH